MALVIRRLVKEDLYPGLLQAYNRYQVVNKVWRKGPEGFIVVERPFTEDWDEALKEAIITEDFAPSLERGGTVFGAFDEDALIAFATLLPDFFGSDGQYVQLMQLHTSYEYRGKGLGKRLFELCVLEAQSWGAKKIYISAHSADETQQFYRGIGCVDAKEVNQRLAELEPYDCQLEYALV